MAFTGVVALASAETVTAAMVFAAVAEVGTALSIVGAVTGDKTLSALGGVMALGGAAGGFISGLGAAGDAATAASAGGFEAGFQGSDVLAGATDASAGLADAAASGVGSDVGAFESGFQGSDALNAANPSANLAAPDAGSLTNSGVATPTSVTTPTPGNVTDSLSVNGAAAPTGPTGPVTPLDNPISSTGAPASSNDFFGNIWQGIKDPKNKTLVNSAMQIGGGLLQGIGQADQFNRALDVKNREQTLNEQVKLGQLALQQQLAANANSQVKFPGIVASARN
ncbi:hypothetical protein D9M73_82610 [compost metagenome]|nr:MAG TPA: hypothetical protein [Caudoviricetes sp.]